MSDNINTENVSAERTSWIGKVEASGKAYAANLRKGVALKWQLSEDLFGLRSTFAQGKAETEAFIATATTASMLDSSVVKNLVRAVEVRNGLTKGQREKIDNAEVLWPTDSVLTLAPSDGAADGTGKVGTAEVTRIIGKAQRANGGRGTTNTKDLRKFRHEVAGTVKRDRQQGAEATQALAAEIRERVEELLQDHKVESIVAGIELRNDHPTGDLVAAVLSVALNPTPATEPVAA